jgi:hypothetical protein
MPTGYTAALYEGKDQTFADFTMNCARAFGALVELRDEPNARIPEAFEPAEYGKRRAAESRAKLREFEDRSSEEWAEAQRREVAEHNAYVSDRIASTSQMRARYEGMLADVRGWRPHTEEHVGLRDFMLQQLEESIRFDCGTSHLKRQQEKPVEEYAEAALRRARDDVQRDEQSWQEEQDRAAGRTAWVQALRASVAAEGAVV